MSSFADTVLKDAIMKLPPPAVGDIPLDKRSIFLDFFKDNSPKDRRLDEKHGCVSFYNDAPTPFMATSAFDIKVFHISGGWNIAFCSRTNPHGRTPTHVEGQTFIYKQEKGKWIDLTDKYLPAGISDRYSFTPRRKKNVIEGEDNRIKPQSGPETRQFDLLWNGRSFKVRKPLKKAYDYDFM